MPELKLPSTLEVIKIGTRREVEVTLKPGTYREGEIACVIKEAHVVPEIQRFGHRSIAADTLKEDYPEQFGRLDWYHDHYVWQRARPVKQRPSATVTSPNERAIAQPDTRSHAIIPTARTVRRSWWQRFIAWLTRSST